MFPIFSPCFPHIFQQFPHVFPPTVQVNESYAADRGVGVENGDDLSLPLFSDGRRL